MRKPKVHGSHNHTRHDPKSLKSHDWLTTFRTGTCTLHIACAHCQHHSVLALNKTDSKILQNNYFETYSEISLSFLV